MRRELLLSGMFRSGTTLLSRMLSATPRALVVSDPFVYFFKAYRNFHYRAAGIQDLHPEQPTSAFFGETPNAGDRRILAADLSEAMPAEDLVRLRADIRAWKTDQHPELCRRLDELRAGSFADVYRQLIDLAADVYGTEAARWVGTKVSWSEEFLPALGRAFPEMRFVLLVRDLRAIVASQNAKTGSGAGKRPLLFYVRHWRKSVAFLRRMTVHDTELRGRCRAVRYEDLVLDPGREARRLAAFLELPFEPAMVTASAFGRGGARGEGEAAWEPNSSYDRRRDQGWEASGGIYTDSLERWRTGLGRAERDALQALVGPELELLGYDIPRERIDLERFAQAPEVGADCEPRFAELAPWLQQFEEARYLDDPEARAREYGLEVRRQQLLESEQPVPGDLFFDERVCAELRDVVRARAAQSC